MESIRFNYYLFMVIIDHSVLTRLSDMFIFYLSYQLTETHTNDKCIINYYTYKYITPITYYIILYSKVSAELTFEAFRIANRV